MRKYTLSFVTVFSVTSLLLLAGFRAAAEEQGTLHRIKGHEQELEKKVETERDRPDKKARAKEFADHVGKNVGQLADEIKGVGHEAGTDAKQEGRKAKADVKAKNQERKSVRGGDDGKKRTTTDVDGPGKKPAPPPAPPAAPVR